MPLFSAEDRLSLLIVGASARAAVHSARRAGLCARGLDLFGDVDMALAGEPISIKDYPGGLMTRLSILDPQLWIDVGGLENYPNLVDNMRLASRHAGHPGHILRRVRDSRELDQQLRAAGFASAWRFDSRDLRKGRWILKPRKSAGGQRVRVIDLPDSPDASDKKLQSCEDWLTRGNQIQTFVDGELMSGSYLAREDRGELLGVTKLLCGVPQLNAPPFAYCGSIGPIKLSKSISDQFESLGDMIACRFGLRGLFGIDVMVREGVCWVLEVNPRYTASIEVLERGLGKTFLDAHLRCFEAKCGHKSLTDSTTDPRQSRLVGKAIVYVPPSERWVVPEQFVREATEINASMTEPRVADIPRPGSVIFGGQPAFTRLLEWDIATDAEEAKDELVESTITP